MGKGAPSRIATAAESREKSGAENTEDILSQRSRRCRLSSAFFRRTLERRIRNSALGAFKPLVDFDWNWPRKIDRRLIESLLDLRWIEDASNIILIGPNGCGKTMLAKNLADHAVSAGHSVRFRVVSDLPNSLAEIDSSAGLTRRIKAICRPKVLVIDEIDHILHAIKLGFVRCWADCPQSSCLKKIREIRG